MTGGSDRCLQQVAPGSRWKRNRGNFAPMCLCVDPICLSFAERTCRGLTSLHAMCTDLKTAMIHTGLITGIFASFPIFVIKYRGTSGSTREMRIMERFLKDAVCQFCFISSRISWFYVVCDAVVPLWVLLANVCLHAHIWVRCTHACIHTCAHIHAYFLIIRIDFGYVFLVRTWALRKSLV